MDLSLTREYSAVTFAASDLDDGLVLKSSAWKKFRSVHLVHVRAHAKLPIGVTAGAVNVAIYCNFTHVSHTVKIAQLCCNQSAIEVSVLNF